MFQLEEESERDEPVAAELAVVDETAGRQTKNGGKGRKRPSLAVSGRGRRAAKRAREPAQPALLEVIYWLIADLQICCGAVCGAAYVFICIW